MWFRKMSALGARKTCALSVYPRSRPIGCTRFNGVAGMIFSSKKIHSTVRTSYLVCGLSPHLPLHFRWLWGQTIDLLGLANM